jgi:hypothetical protein
MSIRQFEFPVVHSHTFCFLLLFAAVVGKNFGPIDGLVDVAGMGGVVAPGPASVLPSPVVEYGPWSVFQGSTVVPGASGSNVSTLFVASSCRVTSDTRLSCLTSEGIGKGLAWRVSTGSSGAGMTSGGFGPQFSSVLMPWVNDDQVRGTSYHPPVIIQYIEDQVKTHQFDTEGHETVFILGNYFGTIARSPSSITAASYGLHINDFPAQHCHVVVDHTRLLCSTTSGAGK